MRSEEFYLRSTKAKVRNGGGKEDEEEAEEK